MARRVDRDEELSLLQHEAEDDSAERKAEDVCAEMNDPWWPANQEAIPEQYSGGCEGCVFDGREHTCGYLEDRVKFRPSF